MNFYAFSLKVPKDWNLLFPGNSLSLILKEKARGKIVVWSVNEKPKSKTIGGAWLASPATKNLHKLRSVIG